MRTAWSKALLVGAAVVASLALSELALRWIGYGYTPLRIQILRKSDWRLHHAFKDKDFVYDPHLIWRPKRNVSVFNAQGYRGKELAEHKEPREVRVFAFGDSNTLGWAGATGPSWPRYLDDLLAERDGGFVVINAGVWGYTAFQGLGRFKEALTFRPDLALISFGANDAHRVSVPDAEFAGREVRRLRLDRILHRLRVGQVLLATLDKAQGRDGELVPRVSVSAYRKCLEEIIRLGRDHDVRIVLLTRPFVGDSPDPGWWKRFAPSYNTATVEVGTRERTPVIDAYEYFKDKDGYFSDESHFTEMGHRIMARLVHERIKPLLDDLERRRRASVAE